MNRPVDRIACMNPLITALSIAAVAAIMAPTALAEDRISETSPPISCVAPMVGCGNPMCPLARKAVDRRKAELRDARRDGSPTKVRKAKQRLAKARHERHESCRGSVL